MNHLTTAQLLEISRDIGAVWGAIGILCSALALVFPKGSKLGYWLAKIGTDTKGHTSPTFVDEESNPPKASQE